jgi:hypothetical protein
VSEPKRIDWGRVAAILQNVVAVLIVLGTLALVVAPEFIHTDTYGVHDWDQMQSYRYLMVKTIKRFHQFPFWNPYSCGGHTWWGGLEAGSSLVSPWLPIYLLAPITWALRLEVIGAALLSAFGAWFLASRFTKSAGLRALVAVAFALNGRFGLQTSVGHMWHLYYAWTPWALFFLDRAIAMAPGAPRRLPIRDATLMGVSIAMMVYMGGIYPLPHTIVVLALYSISCAVSSRSWRPIGCAVAGGLLSFAFAAPRLLPVVDMLRRYPRLVDSPETMDLTALVGVFTVKEGSPHPAVGPWGWHEFGIYTGWIPFLAMLVGLFFAARARERAARFAGAICLVFALGRFSEYAPWALVHDNLPIFESQHVPSRWLFPTVLLLLVAFVGMAERFLARQSRRGWLEVVLLAVAAYVGLDIGLEAQRPMVGAFMRRLQRSPEDSVAPYHQLTNADPSLRYDAPEWTAPNMPSMIANVGVIDCSTFPGLNSYFRDKQGHTPGLGAHGVGEPDYHGEVFTASGQGTVDITNWTPNAVTVSVHGAKPGDLLVLNQNYDAGWRAQGSSAIQYKDTVATRLDTAEAVVTFRFVPRFFVFGCMLTLGAIAGLVWLSRTQRRVMLDKRTT